MVGEVDNLKLSVFERGIYLMIMNIFQVVLGKVSSDSLIIMKCIT